MTKGMCIKEEKDKNNFFYFNPVKVVINFTECLPLEETSDFYGIGFYLYIKIRP